MTSTRSRVTRKTEREYRVLYACAGKAKPIVCTILPGDVLEFKELRGRDRWTLAIDTAFRYAVRLKALADGAEKHRNKPANTTRMRKRILKERRERGISRHA